MEELKVETPYLILSLDGGGTRGLITATFLKQLEENLCKPLHEVFDMFAGTSAGALNAVFLGALERKTEDLIKLYDVSIQKEILNQSFLDTIFNLAQPYPKYDGVGKLKHSKEVFGEHKLKESKKHIVVPAYDIEHRYAKIFSTFDCHADLLTLDAVNASSAAPCYFPPTKVPNAYRNGKKSWFIDGGIVCNNPTMSAYALAKAHLREVGTPNRAIKILSIGTGTHNKKIKGEAACTFGGPDWLANDLISITMDESIVEIQAKLILEERCYLRVNSDLGDVSDELDDITPDNMANMVTLGEKWWYTFRELTLQLLQQEWHV